VAYRDDRQALELQVADLQQENERLKKELSESQVDAEKSRTRGRERRREESMKGCPACGGSMLPAAVFAGNNTENPIPIRFSTVRFSNPNGGFTDSAPVCARVCASCGFIFHYIDITPSSAATSGEHLVSGVMPERPSASEPDDEPEE